MWRLYRQKRGPLNPIVRQDNGFALLAMLVVRAMGGNAEMKDFLPFADDEPEKIATPEDVKRMFKVKS